MEICKFHDCFLASIYVCGSILLSFDRQGSLTAMATPAVLLLSNSMSAIMSMRKWKPYDRRINHYMMYICIDQQFSDSYPNVAMFETTMMKRLRERKEEPAEKYKDSNKKRKPSQKE